MGSWTILRGRRRDEAGSTLVVMLVLLLATFTLTVSALVSARSGLHATRNYHTGTQAMFAAEAGILHAQKKVADLAPVRFDQDVVDDWSTVFGESERSIPGHPDKTYRVSAADDPDDPAEYVLLTSSGNAPEEATRSIVVRLRRSGAFSPGAVYLPDPNVTANFNGNSFFVDGSDTNLDGSPSGNDPVPGIGAATQPAADLVRSELSANQYDNVIGLGSDPSVLRSAGPSVSRIEDEIVPSIVSRPGVVTNPSLGGNDVFGTIASPQITRFTGSVTINGNVSGAGILIVHGGLRINGSADFSGLIIVLGSTEITTVSGNASLLGALWTTSVGLNVSGSASITYSSEALGLANGILPNEDLLPQRVRAVSWTEL